jgi:hypothetical protein
MSGVIPPLHNTPLWRGAQLRHRHNFTFTFAFTLLNNVWCLKYFSFSCILTGSSEFSPWDCLSKRQTLFVLAYIHWINPARYGSV